MSAGVRQALATAANTVSGVKCSPYFVHGTAPGHAYVQLDHIEFPNPFGGVAHWQVFVVLPQDQAQAETWIDTNRAALVDALAPHLVVSRLAVQRLQLDGIGVLPVVVIAGHREAD